MRPRHHVGWCGKTRYNCAADNHLAKMKHGVRSRLPRERIQLSSLWLFNIDRVKSVPIDILTNYRWITGGLDRRLAVIAESR